MTWEMWDVLGDFVGSLLRLAAGMGLGGLLLLLVAWIGSRLPS